MEISTTKKKNVLIASIKGRMDAVTSPDLDRKFGEWLSAGERDLVINLSELEYISSAGLRSILAAAKQIKAHSGRLFIVELKGAVKKVFDLSGFGSFLQILDSEASALSRIG